MPAIAVVDDRDDIRATVVRNIEMSIGNGWEVVSTPPLPCLDDYLAKITEDCIAVLVVDERLNEEGVGVDYTGHDLAKFLRRYFPDFPIFMVTAFENDEELEEHGVVLDNVLSRKQFVDDADTWVPRFRRAGQRFFDVYGGHLADLSALAEKSAIGEITPAEEARLRELQATLNVGFLPRVGGRQEAIDALEELLVRAETVRERVEEELAGRNQAERSTKRTGLGKKSKSKKSKKK